MSESHIYQDHTRPPLDESSVHVLKPFNLQSISNNLNEHIHPRLKRFRHNHIVPVVEQEEDGKVRVDCIMSPLVGSELLDVAYSVASVTRDNVHAELRASVADEKEIQTPQFRQLFEDHKKFFGEKRWNRALDLVAPFNIAGTNHFHSVLNRLFLIQPEKMAAFLRDIEEEAIPNNQATHLWVDMPAATMEAHTITEPEKIILPDGKTVAEELHTIKNRDGKNAQSFLSVFEEGRIDVNFGVLIEDRAFPLYYETLFDPRVEGGISPVISFRIDGEGNVHLCFDPISSSAQKTAAGVMYPNQELIHRYAKPAQIDNFKQVLPRKLNPLFGLSMLTLNDKELNSSIKRIQSMHMEVTAEDGTKTQAKQAMLMLQTFTIPLIPRPNIESMYTESNLFKGFVANVKEQIF